MTVDVESAACLPPFLHLGLRAHRVSMLIAWRSLLDEAPLDTEKRTCFSPLITKMRLPAADRIRRQPTSAI